MLNTGKRRTWLGLVLGLLVCSSSVAHAEPRLTDRGRVLIAGQLAGWWQHKHDWQVAVEPSAAWFFRDHFGVGAYAAYRQLETPSAFSPGATTYEVGVQSVNELALGERLGLFAVVKAGFARRDFKSISSSLNFPVAGDPDVTFGFSPFTQQGRNALHLELFVPLTYLVSPNVGVGFGPQLAIDWYADEMNSDVRIGAASWIAVSF